MTRRIFLVRHGETAFNDGPAQRVRGRVDVPLNEAGERHAAQAGEALSSVPLDVIYYSSVPRARQTAQAIHSRQQASCRFVEEPLAIDISWGDWEGKLYSEAFTPEEQKLFLTDPNRIVPAPNGESFYQVLDRIHRLFQRIRASDEQNICIVSHGSILNLVLCYVTDSPLSHFWDFYGAGCAISELDMDENGHCRIKSLNRVDHLK